MKDKLINTFKETPQRFTYAVNSALSKARITTSKKRLSTPLKVVIAVVLIFAVLPSTVFGAVKMCGIVVHRFGCFGIAFDISINEDAPEYVKMNVEVPEGFKEQEGSGGLKYDRDSEEWEFGFTILPMRFYESIDYTALERNVKEYNKMKIAYRDAFELIGTDDYQGLSRYYVWYNEANILILIYRGDTITDEEFEAFVDCISFTEGTESDHDRFFEPEHSQDPNEALFYEYEKEFVNMPVDTEVVFAGYNEQIGEGGLEVKSVITDIRVTDNINNIDINGINPLFKSEKISDSNGKLLPKNVEIWKYGDGIETEDKLLSCESMNQRLVLVDVKYVNTTDKEVAVYIPHRLETLYKEHGRFVSSTVIDRYENVIANEYSDTEIFYLSSHGEIEKDFYLPKLKPNETKTITLGFRCVDEQLENAYIVLNPSAGGVITPDYSSCSNTYLIFKVQ